MSVYNELRVRIWRAYQDAGNGFHPPEAAQKIQEAFDAFQQPFQSLSGAIDKQRNGLYPNPEAFKNEAGDKLLLLDADMDGLKSAVASAARADNQKISRVIVDQSLAVRKARVQQAADAGLVDQTGKLVQQARGDVKAAGEIPPPGGGSLSRLSPANVTALTEEIAARAAPKEDKIAADQIARIGGQIDPD